MPDSFARSSDGLLFVANGIDPVVTWDGFRAEFENAGMVAPTTAPVIAASGSGALTGSYVAFLRYVDRRGNFSNLSPISNLLSVSAALTINYSNLQSPSEAKVTRRQVLRNTNGQASVFYVDIDTEDLTSTTLSSTRSDTLLLGGDFQSTLDSDARDLSLVNGPPPDYKSLVAAHLDRMFLAGEQEYKEGCVVVTAGSKTVTGVGTEWPSNFEGRFLWVEGGDEAYEIDSVDVVAQTMLLLKAWTGATSPYSTYAIRAALPERRNIYFSEAGQAESWSPFSAVSVQEDGDEITGLMAKGSFLYIFERRHAYRLTFQESPIKDGYVFLTIGRGCVNNRCWIVADEACYMLDQSGCYSFDGGSETEAISEPVQDLFTYTAVNPRRDLYKINWSALRYFHAVYDRSLQVIRWFVTLAGGGLPRHAICYEIRQKRWWIEEYPFKIGSSCVGRINGQDRVVLGAAGARVYVSGDGFLDLVDPSKGTIRGQVASATARSITAADGAFGSDLVGAPLAIVSGRGKGQQRRVRAVSGLSVTVDLPWLELPDDTSTYQIGGIRYRYRTGWFRWTNSEEDNERRLEIIFDPLLRDATVDARVYLDRSTEPVQWETTYTSESANGFSSSEGESDLVADLTKETGFVQRRLSGHKELYVDGPRFVSVELEGVSNAEEVRVISMMLDGARSREG